MKDQLPRYTMRIQRQLLEAEGVPFLPDGRVDVKVCLWETPKDA